MDLSQLSGGGGKYNRLAPGNVINPGLAGGTGADGAAAHYGNIINVYDVNISAALTEMISVNVPAGELLVLNALKIANLNTSNTLSVEIEVDGEVVAVLSNFSSTAIALSLIGQHYPTNNNVPRPDAITDIEVRNNFKVRARKLLTTAAQLTVTFAKMKA